MKKNVLYKGIIYSLIGMLSILVAMIYEFKFEGFLWGLGGAGLGPGILLIWKYFYWVKPENQEEYKERLKVEKIEMKDERKIMLRDKSGRIVNRIMILVYCILIVLFSLFTTIGYFLPFSRFIVMGLAFLLIFQVISGIVVFNNLNSRL